MEPGKQGTVYLPCVNFEKVKQAKAVFRMFFLERWCKCEDRRMAKKARSERNGQGASSSKRDVIVAKFGRYLLAGTDDVVDQLRHSLCDIFGASGKTDGPNECT